VSPFQDLSPPLTRTSVVIDWHAQLTGDEAWSGRALPDQGEIVALSVTVQNDTVWWHKTLKQGAWADAGPGLPIGFWSSDPRSGGVTGLVNVQLRLPGILRCDTLPGPAESPVQVVSGWRGVTGEFAWLASRGHSVAVGALFVASQDVTLARNGAWRLRPAFRDSVRSPWNAVLAGPRRGTLNLSEKVRL
jgi:hypothetical protein